MKCKKLLVIFCMVVGVVNAQTVREKKLPWDYPVKLGMKEWEQLDTRQKRLNACQIPIDVLSSLSTEDLTEICMQTHLVMEVFHYSSYEIGLDSLFKNFNGIRELFKRKDVAKGLLKWYENAIQNLSYLEGDATDVQKGRFTLNIAVMELLFTRYFSPDDALKKNYLEILQILVDGYEKMFMYPESFAGFSFSINIYSRAHQIIKISEQNLEKIPQKDKNRIFISGALDEETLNVINELSYQLIKER